MNLSYWRPLLLLIIEDFTDFATLFHLLASPTRTQNSEAGRALDQLRAAALPLCRHARQGQHRAELRHCAQPHQRGGVRFRKGRERRGSDLLPKRVVNAAIQVQVCFLHLQEVIHWLSEKILYWTSWTFTLPRPT